MCFKLNNLWTIICHTEMQCSVLHLSLNLCFRISARPNHRNMSQQLQDPSSKAPYFSTFAQKRTAIMKRQNIFFCYLCKEKHLLIDHSSVRLLLLSDSIMFNSWKCDNEWQHPGTERLGAVKGHIDMEVKNGATISDLTFILVQKYLNVDHRPIKIILVGRHLNSSFQLESQIEIFSL